MSDMDLPEEVKTPADAAAAEPSGGAAGEAGEPAAPLDPAELAALLAASADKARLWEQRARDAEQKLYERAEAFRRAQGEVDALRGRLERELGQRVRDGLGRAFARILEVLDNLDRAIEHAEPGPMADGVALVRRQLLDALAAEGVERVETVGRAFDPLVAEAVLTTPAESPAQANTVLEEYRAGYRFGDKVLRAAQVRVAL